MPAALIALTALVSQLPAQEPPATAAEAQPAALQLQRAFTDLAAAALPSVVTVRAYVRTPTDAAAAAAVDAAAKAAGWMLPETPDYPGFTMVGAGSGFFVDESGDALTCRHLLQRPDGELADLFDLELHDGSRVIAEAVGLEPTVNLAILHGTVFPNGHPGKVPALRFGDSDAMRTGMWVVGCGDPAGPEQFFAAGSFVKLPQRDCYQDLLSAFFLQVTMTAHPEAYGGPLLNLDGEVIGVLAPRQPLPTGRPAAPRTGLEFALPSKVVAGLYDSIRQARSFRSPWLGFAVMSRAELAAQRGLQAFQALPKPRAGILLENVWQEGPAARVGILPGDWLCGFGDTRIFTPVDFQKCLYLAGIGTPVTLEFWRDGQVFRQQLMIEVRPPAATPR